MLYQLDVSD
jgi:NAD(P)-dependent dehydrogenase (short-subunit alcohol dehydrogenase family)